MAKRLVDKEHLARMVRKPCMIRKAGFSLHNSPVQAHHLLKPSDGRRGLSFKSGDDQVVPLCELHHRELHTKFGDELKFFEHYFGDPYAGQREAMLMWQETTLERELGDDLPF